MNPVLRRRQNGGRSDPLGRSVCGSGKQAVKSPQCGGAVLVTRGPQPWRLLPAAQALAASLPWHGPPIYCKIISPTAIVMKMTNVVPITVAT
jgi:hypothetical protein